MKRKITKILALLLVLILILPVSGCKQNISDGSRDMDSEEETDEEIDDTGADDDREDDSDSEKEDDYDEDKAESNGYVLRFSGENLVYVIDDDGEKLATYDLSKIAENVDLETYPCNSGSLIGIADGILYFQDYSLLPGSDHTYDNMIYAVNGETYETEPLWICDPNKENDYIYKTGMYNGMLYATVHRDGELRELCFERDAEGAKHKISETPYEEIMEVAGKNSWDIFCDNEANRRGVYSESIDRNGFLLAFDYEQSRYFRMYPDGGAKVMEGMPEEYVSIYGYDEENIYYTRYNYDDDAGGFYVYNYDIRDSELIEGYNYIYSGFSILAFENDLVYLTRDTSVEYGHSEHTIYTYDPESGDMNIEAVFPSTPGVDIYIGNEDGFCLAGDDIYVATVIDGAVKWAGVDYDGSTTKFKDIDCPIKTTNVLKYGTVDYASFSVNCPYCDIPLYRYYEECFTLKGEYSENADKINAFLREEFDNSVASSGSGLDESSLSDEDCEYHLENPTMYCETVEDRISDVRIIDDRFLLVDKSGYWYGGGAHGMPSMDQRIFDIKTGEHLSIANFFEGSEEEFKQLCAQKTVEDYNTYTEEDNPYFISDANEIYDEAYSVNSLETSVIVFDENGAYLLYYPYQMGPYAAGFITIQILGDDIYDNYINRE